MFSYILLLTPFVTIFCLTFFLEVLKLYARNYWVSKKKKKKLLWHPFNVVSIHLVTLTLTLTCRRTINLVSENPQRTSYTEDFCTTRILYRRNYLFSNWWVKLVFMSVETRKKMRCLSTGYAHKCKIIKKLST